MYEKVSFRIHVYVCAIILRICRIQYKRLQKMRAKNHLTRIDLEPPSITGCETSESIISMIYTDV